VKKGIEIVKKNCKWFFCCFALKIKDSERERIIFCSMAMKYARAYRENSSMK
jgi:hypothetical protein